MTHVYIMAVTCRTTCQTPLLHNMQTATVAVNHMSHILMFFVGSLSCRTRRNTGGGGTAWNSKGLLQTEGEGSSMGAPSHNLSAEEEGN